MKYLFTFLACLACMSLYSQHHHGQVYDQVMEKQDLFRSAESFNLFGESATSARRNNELSDVLRDGTLLKLDVGSMISARRAEHASMRMTVPRANGPDFELELIESNVISDDFTVFTSSNPDVPFDYTPGKHYMGIVSGDRHSVVALSLFDHQLVGMINTNEGNFVLAKLENTRDQYILYNDKSLVPEFDMGCDMPDDDANYTDEQLAGTSSRDAGDCVRIYVEVHEDITNGKGGVTQATDYVTAVFNQSAILYANDGISITISEMFVWNTTSPYTSNSTSTLLSQFQANNGAFNGDLGHLVGYAGGGGIAAGFAGICNSNPDNSMCYSGIQSTYSNVPTYSWTVMVVTHEMGHLFGSRHTHACVWNGNNTAIDGCAGGTEGSCSLPGNPPGGGTIMSYCHQTSVGINMNNGFGPQPSAVVNNSVNNGSCLSPCSNPTCGTPTGTSTSSITETSASLSWSSVSSANDYTVEWRQTGASSWNSATTGSTSYALSGLTLATDYQWRVRANCSGGSGSYTGIVAFTTGGTPPPQYCSSAGGSVVDEWIATVSLANLTNNTGANGGYADFTAQSADLNTGTNYTVNLAPGYAGTQYSEYWTIWIDYNGDYDFDDAGELVAQANGNTAVSTSFTTPTSVSVSSTRMRVAMKYNAYSSPCETFTWGEVEDYTVNFGGTPPTCDAPTGLSSSSITQTTATISWTAATNAVSYDVQVREQGSSTWGAATTIGGTSTGVTGLSAGTTYEWHVRTNCAGGSSGYSATASFTTDQPAACNAPTGLSTSAITQTTATISWNAASGALDYGVQLRVQGTAWGAETIIGGTAANATGLSANTTYEWRVRTNCSSSSSSYSGIASFTTDPSSGGCTYETIDFNNFESGWGIWNDGGSDCRRSSQDANYAIGTYCVRLRDDNSTGTMSTDNLNLSSFSEVTIDFTYYPRSMDNSSEDFWLQVSTNGGSTYTTVEEWNLNDEFVNNQRYYDQVILTGSFTSSTRFRFRCDASGNSDWVYIDEVQISGCNDAAIHNPTLSELDLGEGDVLSMEVEDEIESLETFEDVRVYPNPVKDELNVEFTTYEAQEVTLYLTSVNGEVLKQVSQFVEAGQNDLTLAVRDAVPGLYALTVLTNDGVQTKMVIIQ
jgi:hypothetical protein